MSNAPSHLSSGSAKVEQMRASKHTEQSGSKTWTAGIDVLRSYPYQDTQWHLHAIEFHHKIRGEAEALRDKWLAAQSGDVAQEGVTPGCIERMVVDAMETSRLEAIEECAKVAENWFGNNIGKVSFGPSAQSAIAAAIRALAISSTDREGGK